MGSQSSDLNADQGPLATILVVDDEPSIRSLLQRFLSKSGYTVLESADGRDALEQLRQSKVDLLISDIVMPERDGLEVLRSLRKDFAGLKVIVMLENFVGMIEGRAKLSATGLDGLRALEVVEAAYRSIATQRAVPL